MADQTVSILAVLRDEISGPLSRAKTAFEGFRTTIGRVQSFAAPLTGTIATLTASVASFAAVSKSLASGESAAEAIQRLDVALEGSKRTRQEIVKVTEDLQKSTVFADDELQSIAARLAAMGVESGKIPRLLQLSVQVSTALGDNIESVADNLGKIATGGEARELNRKIQELRQLKEAGASSDEQLAFLESRYKGFAEAIASTDFGKAKQGLNVIDDAMERIGTSLAKVKSAVVAGLAVAAERIGDAAESPGFRLFVDLLAKAAQYIPEILFGVGALFVALKTLNIAAAFAPLVPILISIVANVAALATAFSPIILVVAGVTAGLVALAASLGAFDGVVEGIAGGFNAIGDELGRVFGLFADGKISARDLFDYVGSRLKQLGISIATPFKIAATLFGGIFDTATALFALIHTGVLSLILQIAVSLKNILFRVIREVAAALDATLGFFGISTKIEAAIPELKFLDEVADSISKIRDGALETFLTAIPNAIRASSRIASDELLQVAALEVKLRRDISNAEARVLAEKVDRARAEVDLERKKITQLLADRDGILKQAEGAKLFEGVLLDARSIVGIGIEQARQLLASLGAEAQEPVRELLIKEFTNQFEGGKVAAKEFVQFRRELEVSFIEEMIKNRREEAEAEQKKLGILEDQRKAIDAQSRSLTIASDIARAFDATDQTALDAEKIAADLESKRVENAKAQKDAAAAILRIDRDRVEIIQKLLAADQKITEDRKKQANDTAATARAEVERLVEETKAIVGSIADGAIAPAEGVERLEAAFVRVDEVVEAARDKVRDLLAEGGGGVELTRALRDVLATLDEIAQKKVVVTLTAGPAIEDALRREETKFKETIERIQQSIQTGEVLPSQTFDDAAAAVERFTEALARARAGYDELISRNPALAAQFAGLKDRIDGTAAALQSQVKSGPDNTIGGFFTGIANGVRGVIGQFDDLKKSGAALGAELTNQLADGLINVWIRGAESMRAFASRFFAFIGEAIAKMLLFKLIAAGINILAGIFAVGGKDTGFGTAGDSQAQLSVTPGALGGVYSFNRGGPVPGPDIRADIVNARLMPKEFVQTRDAVEHYGLGFMEAIRRRVFPRELATAYSGLVPRIISKSHFASGGPVVGGRSSRGGRDMLVVNERTHGLMLAQGEMSQLRFTHRNRNDLRSALEI